ncbi:unnamed protein product [Diamesa serratosioi]
MASTFSKEQLRKEIKEILQNADLEKTSSKLVRTQLGKKLDCDLISRKAEIDKLVMEAVNAMNNTESEESSEDEKPAKGRSSSSKKRKADSSEESDFKPSKSKSKKRKSSESSEDWKEQKKKKVVAAAAPKKRGTGFTRPYTLSPDLAELMGEPELARHEVVKKVWAIIKEKNLYDPKNKQYAICDAQLEKVIGVKRFRTFGMMKYLMPHFLKD